MKVIARIWNFFILFVICVFYVAKYIVFSIYWVGANFFPIIFKILVFLFGLFIIFLIIENLI
ncbi:hypothetical protein CXP39_00970 [Mesoplasma syrphidae]|uniref:Uncharacterized protein n=1 Tax=Mesoplasma syrphidae TaxID=225999 RepID=A0A2K9C517_9MOLU|nr:hypothetical protein CXP39_00970 [Mesoplasma syrphidae]